VLRQASRTGLRFGLLLLARDGDRGQRDVRCPSELSANRSNVTEAEQFLRWRAHIAMPDVVDAMVPAQAYRLREA
jgi:hypothetical protein